MDLKPVTKKRNLTVLYLTIAFAFLYWSIGPTISNSVESILISRAQVYSHTHSLALTPLITEKYYERARYARIEEIEDLSKSATIITTDARVIALQRFLIDYNSPMYPYANIFVREADEYGLNWRLVAAIAGVESAFGKLIPANSNNAWGWRGRNANAQGWSMFDDWGHGIETVTRGLAIGYGVDMDPFEIEPIYCPPCGENPQSLWANGVIKFKGQIDTYLEDL